MFGNVLRKCRHEKSFGLGMVAIEEVWLELGKGNKNRPVFGVMRFDDLGLCRGHEACNDGLFWEVGKGNSKEEWVNVGVNLPL